MANRFRYPCGSKLLLQVALLVPLFTFTQCQKQDDAPPPPQAKVPEQASATRPAAPDCCVLSPATGLEEGMGRLVVAFPPEAEPKGTKVAVRKDSKDLQSGYGSQDWNLPSDTYEITISDKPLPRVAVRAGHEIRVKVGVLHVNALNQTRIELVDPSNGQVLISGYGEQSYGLPVGPINVQVGGQSDAVTIEDGKVTEF